MPPQFQSQFVPNNNPTTDAPVPENNPIPQKPPRKYGFLITLAVILILTGIFGVWYFSNPLPEETDGSTSLTTNKFADWKTYTNTEYGFELKYPSDWSVLFSATSTGPWMLQSSSTAAVVHGIGLPSEGVWINISKGTCSSTADFVAESKPDILEKTVCQNNFQINLGLWQKDQSLTESKSILNKILSTFKFISTSTPANN